MTGFSFGSTSGIITTLGLMVGLHSVSTDKLVVLGGILTIAIADAFSDALGMHVSEEAENKHTTREIWEATISTWAAKFITASTFLIPLVLFSVETAIIVSVIYGLSLLSLSSYFLAKKQGVKPIAVIFEHVFIAGLVIAITHYIGDIIHSFCAV
jgi:VIT1/CCC1 family predicted Fe2+/Mn2+ transporter